MLADKYYMLNRFCYLAPEYVARNYIELLVDISDNMMKNYASHIVNNICWRLRNILISLKPSIVQISHQ